MRRQLLKLSALSVCWCLATATFAADFVNQVFESGTLVGAVDNSTNNGVPSTTTPDQWHLWSVSGNNRAQLGTTGRTFQTGTNDEALFLKLATPGASESDLEGATFHSSTPYAVLPGQIVYTVAETFSDIGSSSASQLFKVDVRFGSAGNSLDYGGFSNSAPEWSVNSNANTLTNGTNQGVASVTSGSGASNAAFSHIKYDGAVAESSPETATAAFDRSYLMTTVYRPIAGGTNAEMASVDGLNPARYGDSATINEMHTSMDRVTIHLRRHIGAYNGVNKSEFNSFGPLSAFPEGATNTASAGYASSILRAEETGEITNPQDIKMGIKSLRIGATWLTDVNLDGVVNAGDKAIVEANQGTSSATLLQGDVTNDGVVDASDLALYATLLGDYDGSGSVDGGDFLLWQRQLGSSVTASTGADGNGNGIVDDTDLAVWRGQFGQGSAAAAVASAIPEPNALVLASLAGCGALGYRRDCGSPLGTQR